MIRSFADKETEKLFRGAKATAVPPQIRERALSKLLVLNAATNVEDPRRAPPGNRLEKLRGDREGQWSIRVNRQYRVCFSWIGADAHDVEITDYH